MVRSGKAISSLSGLTRHVRPLLAVACLVGAAVWFFWGYIGTAPPVPGNLDDLDPKVVKLVRQGVDAVSRNRHNFDLWVQLGMVYEANALFGEAIECYSHAITMRPTDAKSWYRLAMAHERTGDLKAAIEAIRHAAALDDRYAPVHWRYGMWLLDVGRIDDAQQQLTHALELDPNDRAAWFGMVRVHLGNRQNDRAVEVITERNLLRGTNSAYAYQLLGTAYRQMGKRDEAREALTKGGHARPQFSDEWTRQMQRFRTGFAAMRIAAGRYLQRGQIDRALPILEELRERDASDRRVLNMLAACYLQQQDFERSRRALEAALRGSEDDYVTNLNMAEVLLRMSQTERVDLNAALRHVDKAINARPEAGHPWRIKGGLLAMLGRSHEAVEALKAAFQRDARDVSVLLIAGQFELQLSRWSDALNTFQTVLNADPTNGLAWLGAAAALVELGEHQRAAEALRHAEGDSSVDRQRVQQLREHLDALRRKRTGGDTTTEREDG